MDTELTPELISDFKAAVDRQNEVTDKTEKDVAELKETVGTLDVAVAEVKRGLSYQDNPAKYLEKYGTWGGGEIDQADADLYDAACAALYYRDGHTKYLEEFEARMGPVNKAGNIEFVQPVQLYPQIWAKLLQRSVFLQDAKRIAMSSNHLTYPYLDVPSTVQFIGKGVSITESDSQEFQQLTYNPDKLSAFMAYPYEDLDDSLPAMMPTLTNDVMSQMSRVIDTMGFIGGVANASGSGVLEHLGHTVDAGALVTDIGYDDIWAAIGSLDTVEQTGAKFYMHPTIWAQVRSLVDTGGMPIWQPSLSNVNQLGTLCGYPVVLVDAMPSAAPGASSTDTLILFGNLSHWPYGDRMSLSFDFSDHFLFQNYKRAFRWVLRIAFPQFEASTNSTLENYYVGIQLTTA